MNTPKRTWLAAAAIASLAVTTGCTDNNVSMFIRHVPVPDPEDGCSYSNDPSASFLIDGKLDKSLATEYSQTFLVGNQLVPRGDADTLRPETSRVAMFEAEITVFRNDGAELASFSVPTSGHIDESQGTTPGFGIVAVSPVIDAATLSARSIPGDDTSPFLVDTSAGGSTVVARVQLFGETLGGIAVETGTYDWPVFVCGENGVSTCIGTYPPENKDDPVRAPCRVGQDQPHDCRFVDNFSGVSGHCL